jgi:tRNA(Ile)-lysidine synthase
MLERFNSFVQAHQLIQPTDRLLLALSGGVDSMALANLFLEAKISFEVAHCNFQLRGLDSDADEDFVVNWCKEKGVVIHVKKVNIASHVNVQIAARNLRYQWFSELLSQENLNKIATAHHANDMVETMFINLLRGAGHKGWSGIPLANQNTIRPLLFATKSDISEYAAKNKIAFREDVSNQSDKYLRNQIRHSLLPSIQVINKNGIAQIAENQLRLQASNTLLRTLLLEANKAAISQPTMDEWVIDVKTLQPTAQSELVLFELLQEYGFNWAQIQMVFNAKHSGKSWKSSTHQLLLDRGKIHIRPISSENEDFDMVEVNADEVFIKFPIPLSFDTIQIEQLEIPKSNRTAALDKDKLEFPLQLRKWRIGDRFQPIGMQGTKLLSDFFNDQKLNNFEKELVYVLTSNDEIVWVVGYRISENFKIGSATKQCFLIDCQYE